MSFRLQSNSKPVVPVRRSSSLTKENSSHTKNYKSFSGNDTSNVSLRTQKSYYSPCSAFKNSNYFENNKGLDSMSSVLTLNKTMVNNNQVSNSIKYSYISPYKVVQPLSTSSTFYTPVYTNRFVCPYTSYKNGITTAGLNIQMGTLSPKTKSVCTSVSPVTKLSSYITKNLSHSNISNTSVQNKHTSSIRDQERKSRSRARKKMVESIIQAPQTRSSSISSKRSEGYQVRNT